MKKIVTILLAMVIVISLCACAGPKKGGFTVGYGRVDLSPANISGVVLQGYGGNGTPPTPMTGILDRIYGTCVAITDADGNTVLIYTVDTLFTTLGEANELREVITKKTGVPGERVVINATHTHASPYYSDITDYFNKMAKAAEDALADRAPATVLTGSVDIQGLNFVRHYVTENGQVVGDNFNQAISEENQRVNHATEADREMQIIRYVREGDKKDILMVNWQAHPKVSSTSETPSGKGQRSLLSADFVGWCRTEVEKQLDCHFAYYTGAAGNLNAISHLPEEKEKCPELVNEFGAELARQLIAGLDSLQETPSDKVLVEQKMVDVVPVKGSVSQMEVTAIRIGNVAFATVPFEMFDTNGMQIKEGSDCDITFVLGYAHMVSHEYIPAEYVWDYDTGPKIAYELDQCDHERGTAEKVADALVAMINGLNPQQ